MKKNTKIVMACVWGFFLSFTSCVDNQYNFNNLDTSMRFDTEWAAPLAHTHLLLEDFMPAEISGLDVLVDDDKYYLATADTQYMGNELINNVKILPSGVFRLELPLVSLLDPVHSLGGTLLSNLSYDLDKIEPFQFADINTNPNERLDSILFDQSPLKVTVTTDIALDPSSYIDIAPIVTELRLDPVQYPDNKVHVPMTGSENTEIVNLLKSHLYLNGGNTIHFHITGKLLTTGAVSPDQKIVITVSFDQILPYLSYANIGSARDLYEGEKVIDFDYNKNFQVEGGFFPFYDPIIGMICESNIGLPARYYIDYVEAFDSKTGESVRADFGGPNPDTTSVLVTGPSFETIKGLSDDDLFALDLKTLLAKSQVTFNRAYGHTDRLFKIKADKMRYHYRIRSVEQDPHNVHFLFQNSDMNLIEQTYLQLWFEGDPEHPDKNAFYQAIDTVPITMNPLDTGEFQIVPETKGQVEIDVKNFIAAGIKGKVSFLDAANQPILAELNQIFDVPAAEVDAQGLPSHEVEKAKAALITLNYAQLESFMRDVKSLKFEYLVSNEAYKTIQFRPHDWFEAKARMYISGAVIFDPAQVNKGGTQNAK